MPGEGFEQMSVLAALDRNECRSVEHIAAITGLSHKSIVSAAGRLIVRTYVERAERGCFTLTQEGERAREAGVAIKSGPRGALTARSRRPKRRTIRDRLWGALRIRGKASVPELIELVSTDDEVASVHNVQLYLRVLVRAGYLRELPRREPGTALTSNGFKRFLLMRDTGPLAPQYRPQSKSIYDPNTDEIVGMVVFE